MPCNSAYMNATSTEVTASRLTCLIGELNGHPWTADEWRGYHVATYGKATSSVCDALAAQLCFALTTADVTQYSLEMQIWWRDHQAADAARAQQEAVQNDRESVRSVVLAKLTPEERRALGVSDAPA